MNKIAPLLTANNVVAGHPAGSKRDLFEFAGQLFEKQCGLSMRLVADALAAREQLGSTALGHGIAIPHGRIKGLTEACGAFIRLATPIDFDASDGRPVHLVFVLLVPENANEKHLQLIAELAQMFSAPSFRDKLVQAPDAASLRELFTTWSAS